MNRKLILIIAIVLLIALSIACQGEDGDKWRHYQDSTAGTDAHDRAKATASADNQIESPYDLPPASPRTRGPPTP